MTLFCIHGLDDQNRWNLKNCPKFFHREIFAFWIQIYNPNLWNPIHFEIQLVLKMTLFRLRRPDDQSRWNKKNCPKFFHRVIFAFWIQICNPNSCKSHIFWNTANIENDFVSHTWTWWPKLIEIGKIAINSS